jgi:hypothetical protein
MNGYFKMIIIKRRRVYIELKDDNFDFFILLNTDRGLINLFIILENGKCKRRSGQFGERLFIFVFNSIIVY